MSRLFVPHEMLVRYDQAGPRYTSYPTAPQWTETFAAREFRAEIERTNQQANPPPLALYTHIPFCESMCFYCGCNIIISGDTDHADPYAAHLFREAEWYQALMAKGRQVVQWHIGGGSPTFMRPDQLDRLLAGFRARFPFAPDAELSMEVDPRITSTGHLDVLKANGFNRVSMGIQDFDAEVQKTVNRIQPYELTRDFMAACRARGFNELNVDLIYGLPKQTLEGFGTTLDRVIATDPDRLSIYNYAHMPTVFKPQRRIHEEDLPAPQVKLDILNMAVQKLTGAGYVYIGMDHFAKPEDELAVAQRQGRLHRNFQGYSTHSDCDLVALGVSAIGKIGPTYSQNYRDLENYYDALERNELPIMRGLELNADDLVRRAIIQALMCHFELSKESFNVAYLIDFDRYFAAEMPELEDYAREGLLELSPQWITVTPKGRMLIRNICMVFDKYLRTKQEHARYSKVI